MWLHSYLTACQTFWETFVQEKMIVEYDNAKVLITDMKIESIKEIIPILEQVTRVNQPLVIIAEDVTGKHQIRDSQRVGVDF